MKLLEMEKAAYVYVDKAGKEQELQSQEEVKRGFEAGVGWALEYLLNRARGHEDSDYLTLAYEDLEIERL